MVIKELLVKRQIQMLIHSFIWLVESFILHH